MNTMHLDIKAELPCSRSAYVLKQSLGAMAGDLQASPLAYLGQCLTKEWHCLPIDYSKSGPRTIPNRGPEESLGAAPENSDLGSYELWQSSIALEVYSVRI